MSIYPKKKVSPHVPSLLMDGFIRIYFLKQTVPQIGLMLFDAYSNRLYKLRDYCGADTLRQECGISSCTTNEQDRRCTRIFGRT